MDIVSFSSKYALLIRSDAYFLNLHSESINFPEFLDVSQNAIDVIYISSRSRSMDHNILFIRIQTKCMASTNSIQTGNSSLILLVASNSSENRKEWVWFAENENAEARHSRQIINVYRNSMGPKIELWGTLVLTIHIIYKFVIISVKRFTKIKQDQRLYINSLPDCIIYYMQ